MQPGHVVFMHMAQHDQIGVVEVGADPVGDRRRVEHHMGVGAAHDNLVAVGVLAVLVTEKNGDPAKIGARREGIRNGSGRV